MWCGFFVMAVVFFMTHTCLGWRKLTLAQSNKIPKEWRLLQGVWSRELYQCWVWRQCNSEQTATIQLKPRANASWHYEIYMSCRHCASQLASFGRLLVFGPWAAQPSVESAGGMEDLLRWTAEGCALAATSTTWPLCGTSSDW